MKIKLSRAGGKVGSVLLVIVVATLVVVGGGYASYKIYKWAKRVDGGRYKGGIYTNDTEGLLIPPSNGTNEVYWADARVWFEWDHTIPTGSPLLSLRASNATAAYTTTAPLIFGTLSKSGAVLRITYNSTELMLVGLKDLGVPLDDEGVPTDFTWSSVVSDQITGMPASLKRSTNFLNWEQLVVWQMATNFTNIFQDTFAPSGRAFYQLTAP